MRGLGGAGESSVWAQPEAATPCLACKVPRAVGSARVRATAHGRRGSWRQVVKSRLCPEGVFSFVYPGSHCSIVFDDFPTGLADEWTSGR